MAKAAGSKLPFRALYNYIGYLEKLPPTCYSHSFEVLFINKAGKIVSLCKEAGTGTTAEPVSFPARAVRCYLPIRLAN